MVYTQYSSDEDNVGVTLQFVLLMDLASMMVEWRCITVVYGVQFVIMDGI